jgi:hypothetical protein
LSLRATRRSWIAALTVGASLAVAGSASAIPVPIGSSGDPAYSGTGTPTSVYSLYNAASHGLVGGEDLIYAANKLSEAQSGPPIDPNFDTAAWNDTNYSDLTSTTVPEIATDIANSSLTSDFELVICIQLDQAANPSDTTMDAINECQTSGNPYMPQAVATFTADQPLIASAAASWPDLSQLVGFLTGAAGVMQSSDSATITSSGTVTSLTDPVAYNISLNAPTGGYVVPSAFSLTFPAGLAVNTALVADEVNASSNTAAVELNPGTSATSIGTVTLTSPLADEFGGANNQLTGNVYVVQTGQSSGQGSATQPYLELWFPAGGHPIYDLGSFPSSLSFPLTLNFGEAFVSLLNKQEPLPLNSVALSFPAATSPVKTTDCTTLGTATGSITDSIASLAYEFGDKTDGATSASTTTPTAVNVAGSATTVTNQCVATVATPPAKPAAIATASGLNKGTPTIKVKVTSGTAFKSLTIGLPKGLSFAKLSAKKLAKAVSGAKIKSVRRSGSKLMITLKSAVKSETIQTKKGLVNESSGLIKSIKKHETKKLSLSIKVLSSNLKASFKA